MNERFRAIASDTEGVTYAATSTALAPNGYTSTLPCDAAGDRSTRLR